ncbi:MAG: helix-turn-helix transcriptional regulator [Pseudonocardiales bacterium]|nr:helix-turn-helix transcriptional regulator [Pseudonocardiales bacterium]MBV9029557.1 helix-turn-helix transcriptional regulator [Pseudonocardiales bacterium]MBW0010816.1 helix-turn-helix transcriptional regulator [Pseudonocardiales bacterium]
MPKPIIGERIRELRKPRLTQHDLAAMADVSVDVIRKLEQGRRHTASIGTLQRIARALDVDVAELLGHPRAIPATDDDQSLVSAIRDALTSVDDLLGELDDVDAPGLSELSRAVSYAFGAYWAGRYGPLTAMLPRLLTDAVAAVHGAAASEAGRAADLASQVHRITASTLLHLGAPDLGFMAAREALRLAALTPDPLRAAAARNTLGHVLLRQGRFVDAERVLVATAEGMQPTGNATTAHLSVYGGVLLRGAAAAARQGRARAAADLISEATETARRTGADRTDYDVVFGPSNVVMQSTDCSVVIEDYVAAAEVAQTMPRDAALPLSTRSRHLVDVAHAQLRLGHARAAESTLLTMERAAPEWTAHQRLPRVLVGELMTRGRPSTRLRELAHRLNAAR